MPVYHVIHDKGPDWPDDGDDRYDHFVFGTGDIEEVKLDWEAHEKSKKRISKDIKRLTEISAWCKDAGHDFPKELMALTNSFEEDLEEWEPPAPPTPKSEKPTRICFGMLFQAVVEPGITVADALKLKEVAAMQIPKKNVVFLNEDTKQKVDLDYVLEKGDTITAFRRMGEKGTTTSS